MDLFQDKALLDEETSYNRMVENINKNNIHVLDSELIWFSKIIDTRIKLHFGHKAPYSEIFDIKPPVLKCEESSYGRFIIRYNFSNAERIVFLLALIPNIKPQLLDIFLTHNEDTGRPITEFGGRARN